MLVSFASTFCNFAIIIEKSEDIFYETRTSHLSIVSDLRRYRGPVSQAVKFAPFSSDFSSIMAESLLFDAKPILCVPRGAVNHYRAVCRGSQVDGQTIQLLQARLEMNGIPDLGLRNESSSSGGAIQNSKPAHQRVKPRHVGRVTTNQPITALPRYFKLGWKPNPAR